MKRAAKKLFFKIGEVCRVCELQPHVLRYWESEFPILSPAKNRAGQRIYRDRDLELIQLIKVLLYEEGYTIAGARRRLKELSGGKELPLFSNSPDDHPLEPLAKARREIDEILRILEEQGD